MGRSPISHSKLLLIFTILVRSDSAEIFMSITMSAAIFKLNGAAFRLTVRIGGFLAATQFSEFPRPPFCIYFHSPELPFPTLPDRGTYDDSCMKSGRTRSHSDLDACRAALRHGVWNGRTWWIDHGHQTDEP